MNIYTRILTNTLIYKRDFYFCFHYLHYADHSNHSCTHDSTHDKVHPYGDLLLCLFQSSLMWAFFIPLYVHALSLSHYFPLALFIIAYYHGSGKQLFGISFWDISNNTLALKRALCLSETSQPWPQYRPPSLQMYPTTHPFCLFPLAMQSPYVLGSRNILQDSSNSSSLHAGIKCFRVIFISLCPSRFLIIMGCTPL